MRKYPLLGIALLFIAGLVVANYLHLDWRWLFALAITLLLPAIFLERTRVFLLPLLLIITGALGLCLRTGIISPSDIRTVVGSSNQIAIVRGHLTETPYQRLYE